MPTADAHRAHLEAMLAAQRAANRKPIQIEAALRAYIQAHQVPAVAVAHFLDGTIRLVAQEARA